MQKVHVSKAFIIRSAENTLHRIEAGVQVVEDWIADHWFAKAHFVGDPEPVDSPEDAADIPVGKLKLPQLKDRAKALGVEGFATMAKADLVQAITDAEKASAPNAPDPNAPDPNAPDPNAPGPAPKS